MISNTFRRHRVWLGTLAASLVVCASAAYMNWESILNPGLHFAALFFPEGIHGNQPRLFLVVWFSTNTAILWAILHWPLRGALFLGRRKG